MAVSANDLRTEVRVSTSEAPDAVLSSCVSTAELLLKQYAGDDWVTVPIVLQERAWLAVAVELFNQRSAPNGVLSQAFTTFDGGQGVSPIRVSADPLRPAYPLLERWVIGTSFA